MGWNSGEFKLLSLKITRTESMCFLFRCGRPLESCPVSSTSICWFIPCLFLGDDFPISFYFSCSDARPPARPPAAGSPPSPVVSRGGSWLLGSPFLLFPLSCLRIFSAVRPSVFPGQSRGHVHCPRALGSSSFSATPIRVHLPPSSGYPAEGPGAAALDAAVAPTLTPAFPAWRGRP